MNEILEKTIEKAQHTIESTKYALNKTYEEQAKILTESKELLDQFYKQVKNYEHLQFYLTEVSTTPPAIFKVKVKYKGQPIADIGIFKDNITISTDLYNESNKKTYNCDIQLKQGDLSTKETIQFLEHFKDITPKGKIDEQAHTKSMLLAEFSKTSSYDKLLTRNTAYTIQ